MSATGIGSYGGYPGSNHWSVDSRPLSEATSVLRTFVLNNIVQDNQWEIDRITKYYLYWKFYEGMHYKDFNDGLLSFNYVRAFIDKVNMFLLGDEAFTFKVQSLYSSIVDKEVETLAEALIMYHWKKSNKTLTAYEMLQMGSVTGDVWVGVSWDDDEKFCKVNVFDSRQCFVTFKDGRFDKMESFIVRQSLDSPTSQYRLFAQRWTKEKIETWYQKDVSIDYNNVAKYERKIMDNPYNFIPVVHIKNRPNAAGYYGKSDANDILKINKVFNETMQQLKSVIDYHVTPTTVITGGSAKSLKKGLGQIWSGLPAEASVFNLGLDVDLSATVSYVKDLKTSMHELSDVPENALGKIQAISNTSGAALQITYQPIIQQANLKATTYGKGISTINNMILRILEIKDPENKRLKRLKKIAPEFLEENDIVPVFCYGFPKDKMDELTRGQIELGLNIASKREIMERLGKENIPELLQEIENEKLEDNTFEMRLQALFAGIRADLQNTAISEQENQGAESTE